VTGKDLIIATFNHKETPRLPWVPFAGVHAGLLKDYGARTVLADVEKDVKAAWSQCIQDASQFKSDLNRNDTTGKRA